jgi:FtsP/CotA-like multicopper oxidase with cupredoxin domain
MSDENLKKYRWTTPLNVPQGVALGTTAKKMYVGLTSKQHVFALGQGGLPNLQQRTWGYGPDPRNIRSPGPTLVATAGTAATIEWINLLPWGTTAARDTEHPFVEPPRELNTSMMGRYGVGHVVTHLHGAHVPWTSDGYPVRPHPGLAPPAPTGTTTVHRPGKNRVTTYPNCQAAGAMLWYHDHTMDATAKNVYAGLAGGYLLRHPDETATFDTLFKKDTLTHTKALGYEIPLVIQDRSFTEDGELLYGDADFLNRYLAPRDQYRYAYPAMVREARRNPVDVPMAEFKGQALCVNGGLWPTVNLERRPYRFRILNGCNSRMLVLRLSAAGTGNDPSSRTPMSDAARAIAPMLQIGSDGGLFAAPVELGGSLRPATEASGVGQLPATQAIPRDVLILAPGERADVVIDLSRLPGGTYFLTNHATEGAWPDGTYDGYGNKGDKAKPGLTDAALRICLPWPDQAVVRSFRGFRAALDGALAALAPPAGPVQPQPVAMVDPGPDPAPVPRLGAVRYRKYTIAEQNVSLTEPLLARTRPDWNAITLQESGSPAASGLWAGSVPTASPGGPPMGGPVFDAIDLASSASKHVLDGQLELWEFWNTTADVHPMHLHHSMFYVLSRWDLDSVTHALIPNSKSVVDANEQAGWKDTVRVNPGQVTRLLVRFDNQGDTANNYTGHYVFHCHLLEHEDMGMMRPLEIFP